MGKQKRASASVVLGHAAVDVTSGEPRPLTEVLPSRQTPLALTATPAEPRHPDTLTRTDTALCTVADRFDDADDLMAEDSWWVANLDLAVQQMQIGATYAASSDAQQQLPFAGPGDLALAELQWPTDSVEEHRPHASSPEEQRGRFIQPGVEQLRLCKRSRQVDLDYIGALQRDHLAEAPAGDGVHRADTKARGQDPVVGDRGAAALQVTEDRHTGLIAGVLLDLPLERHADAAESRMAERVGLSGTVNGLQCPLDGRCSLGDDNNREAAAARVAAAQMLADLLDVEWPLWNEDRVGARSHPGVGSNPAGVASITSTTITRLCDSAVVCRRSIASVTICTAV